MAYNFYNCAVWGTFPGEDAPRLLPGGTPLPGRLPKGMERVEAKFQRLTGRALMDVQVTSAKDEPQPPSGDPFQSMTIQELRAAAKEHGLVPVPTATAKELRAMLREEAA